MIRRFLAALQFLTILPVRTHFEVAEIGRSVFFFPVVGLLIGLTTTALDHFLFEALFPPPVAALLAISTLGAASGGLHLDGLADTADGFLSARPRERILEIMRDSRIGTMGAFALLVVLGLKVTALMSAPSPERWRALLLAPVAGRCMLVTAMSRAPYARTEHGLLSVFLENRHAGHAAGAVLFLTALSIGLFGWAGLLIVAVSAGVTALLNSHARRKIGGVTGDTLGAVCELVETCVFMTALEISL